MSWPNFLETFETFNFHKTRFSVYWLFSIDFNNHKNSLKSYKSKYQNLKQNYDHLTSFCFEKKNDQIFFFVLKIFKDYLKFFLHFTCLQKILIKWNNIKTKRLIKPNKFTKRNHGTLEYFFFKSGMNLSNVFREYLKIFIIKILVLEWLRITLCLFFFVNRFFWCQNGFWCLAWLRIKLVISKKLFLLFSNLNNHVFMYNRVFYLGILALYSIQCNILLKFIPDLKKKFLVLKCKIVINNWILVAVVFQV